MLRTILQHPYMQWSIHAVVHTYSGPYMQWSIHAVVHTCSGPYMYTVVHTCSGPYMQWSIHAVVHTCSGPYMQWSIHTASMFSAQIISFGFTCVSVCSLGPSCSNQTPETESSTTQAMRASRPSRDLEPVCVRVYGCV